MIKGVGIRRLNAVLILKQTIYTQGVTNIMNQIIKGCKRINYLIAYMLMLEVNNK